MNNWYITATLILAALIIPVISSQTVQAKPHSLFSDIGQAREDGMSAGIAAFKAGLADSPNCPAGSGGGYCLLYNDAFHSGYREAQDVAP
jgi:hypothetical protein